ncbi:MAG: hypothetical protein JEZ02_03470 [Desulfatibacillum sp.]|nr:hypothetical protein [Desulfatibacillum sp.]
MKKDKAASLLIGLGFLAYLAPVLILCATPPFARDALIHHLAIPKIWLRSGGMCEIPWAPYSYHPMNLQLLYWACLFFKSDIAPKFVNMAFGLGTGLLIFSYLRTRVSLAWAGFGSLFFLTVPVILKLQTTVYVDLGLAFFISASVLVLLKWMDQGYGFNRWLVLAAFCMGLAVGTKPNGLLAWGLVCMLLVFFAARDNAQSQWKAIWWGGLFFLITLLVVSPWYIKNYLLTGNPFYPLFASGSSAYPLLSNDKVGADLSIFYLRQQLYGEGLLDYILIPVRLFFSGQDDTPQFFDGVLNPLLLVLAPFAFGLKSQRKHTVFMGLFCLLFLILAFLKSVPRVRYVVCIVPFLAIMATMGLVYMQTLTARAGLGKKIFQVWLPVLIAVLGLGYNARYLHTYFLKVNPMPYVLGQESRDTFLEKHVGEYKVVKFINENLPKDARIMLLYMGRRGYYLDRDYFHCNVGGLREVTQIVQDVLDGKSSAERLRSYGGTHVLMKTDFLLKEVAHKYDQAQVELFVDRFQKENTFLFQDFPYAVLKIGRAPGQPMENR